MEGKLLEYYNRELAYLREMGAEFAERYPKVAGRLGMRGIEVADPYVERMMEGFAFLTSRVQLKMDAEFPRFSQRLLEMIAPGGLAHHADLVGKNQLQQAQRLNIRAA
ncbi:type VI secretion system baseplate subunit TssF [Klebsiella aerogenes]|uniref:type VI secretion system baseplate subunit TssF n=1 Tax=Klebsiella aerogenes TaxID=548 RepID=UPI003877E8D6